LRKLLQTVECVVPLVMGEMHVVEQSGICRFCCDRTKVGNTWNDTAVIHKSKFPLTKPASTPQLVALECLIVSLSFSVVKSTFLMVTCSFSALAKSKLKQHLLMNPKSIHSR
jgi:hypothetical protein